MTKIREAETFSAEQFVTEKIRKATETPLPRFWKHRRLPQFIIKELVEEAMHDVTEGDRVFLMSYWATIYRRKTSGQETPKNCVRHLPLWELNFRPGERDSTRFVRSGVDACVPC